MARKKKSGGGSGPGAPLWMATYGDMVTLVLCFFVLLYSMSTIDAKKFEEMAESMQKAFNISPGGPSSVDSQAVFEGGALPHPGDSSRPSDSNQVYTSAQVLALVQNALNDDQDRDQVTISITDRGVVVSLSEQLLYDEGSAVIRPEALRLLYKIGGILARLPNTISVEGHTDSAIPERSIYIDNWGLSAARAARVTSYLNDQMAVPQGRIRAVGFGAAAPLVPNNSEENMRLNRRVDIVILSLHAVR